MFNLFSMFFIMSNLFLFSILSMFLNDLFIIWLFMEINNFMFISLMCFKIFNKKIIFFYYIIQTMASLLIIFSIIYSSLFFSYFNFFNLILILGLSIKLGIPPFHMWMVSSSMFFDWDILFLFLSIQKIIPMYMLSTIELKSSILYPLILSSSYISMFKMLMNLNFKIILTYSSINQTSWVLLLIMFKNLMWILYFATYSAILFLTIMTLKFLYMSPNFIYSVKSLNFKLMFMFMFFNLASLPPLSFFFMKWFSVYMFIFNSPDLTFLIVIMLINSFILIYIYINMMTLLMFFFSIKSKLFFMYNYYPFKKLYFIMFLGLLLSLFMIMI
uniref:NADH-ubiquinone oxidoreductase chain 2 n=1 Tax=Camponotus vafer TaxID=251259 RepID=G9J3F7_9HYME|nr:NADH dehydrogenase subunit 2 [Camponotus vafer]